MCSADVFQFITTIQGISHEDLVSKFSPLLTVVNEIECGQVRVMKSNYVLKYIFLGVRVFKLQRISQDYMQKTTYGLNFDI